MQYLKAPMVGDPQYGIGNIIPHKQMSAVLKEAVLGFKRQALHAIKLGLIHPVTNEFMEWQVDLAEDMKGLLDTMRHEESPVWESGFNLGIDENGLYTGGGDDDWDGEGLIDESDDGLDEELLNDSVGGEGGKGD